MVNKPNEASTPGRYTFTIERCGVKLDCTVVISGKVPADYDVEIVSVKLAADSCQELLAFIEDSMTLRAVTLYSMLESEIRHTINKRGGI